MRRLLALILLAASCGDRVVALSLPEEIGEEAILAVRSSGETTLYALETGGLPEILQDIDSDAAPVDVQVAAPEESFVSLAIEPGVLTPYEGEPRTTVRYRAVKETRIEFGRAGDWRSKEPFPELGALTVPYRCPDFDVSRVTVAGDGRAVGARIENGVALAVFGPDAYYRIDEGGSQRIGSSGARTAIGSGANRIWLADGRGHLFEGRLLADRLDQSLSATVASGPVGRIRVEGGRVHTLARDGTYGVTDEDGFRTLARLEPSPDEFFLGGMVARGADVTVGKEGELLEVAEGRVVARTSIGRQISDLVWGEDLGLLLALGGVDLRLLAWPSGDVLAQLPNLTVSMAVVGGLLFTVAINGVLSVISLDPLVDCGPLPVQGVRITTVIPLGPDLLIALSSPANAASEILFFRLPGSG